MAQEIGGTFPSPETLLKVCSARSFLLLSFFIVIVPLHHLFVRMWTSFLISQFVSLAFCISDIGCISVWSPLFLGKRSTSKGAKFPQPYDNKFVGLFFCYFIKIDNHLQGFYQILTFHPPSNTLHSINSIKFSTLGFQIWVFYNYFFILITLFPIWFFLYPFTRANKAPPKAISHVNWLLINLWFPGMLPWYFITPKDI